MAAVHLSVPNVTAFLACEHLTTLSLRQARGEIEKPDVENEQAELIFRKGLEHEHAYLETLRAEGKTICEIEFDGRDWEDAQARTIEAMRSGADVVYQGVFASDGWRGVADFLLRRTEATRRSTPSSRAARSPPTSSSSSSTRVPQFASTRTMI